MKAVACFSKRLVSLKKLRDRIYRERLWSGWPAIHGAGHALDAVRVRSDLNGKERSLVEDDRHGAIYSARNGSPLGHP